METKKGTCQILATVLVRSSGAPGVCWHTQARMYGDMWPCVCTDLTGQTPESDALYVCVLLRLFSHCIPGSILPSASGSSSVEQYSLPAVHLHSQAKLTDTSRGGGGEETREQFYFTSYGCLQGPRYLSSRRFVVGGLGTPELGLAIVSHLKGARPARWLA